MDREGGGREGGRMRAGQGGGGGRGGLRVGIETERGILREYWYFINCNAYLRGRWGTDWCE